MCQLWLFVAPFADPVSQNLRILLSINTFFFSKHYINSLTQFKSIPRHSKSIIPNSPFAKILPSQTPPDPYLALSFWPHTHLDFRVHSRPSEYLSHHNSASIRNANFTRFSLYGGKFKIRNTFFNVKVQKFNFYDFNVMF